MTCDGTFEDVHRNGRLEYVMCDDPFAYQYCCGAQSPTVKVILQYRPGYGFVPASPLFPQEYASDIWFRTQTADQAIPGDHCEVDNTTKCSVLAVVMDHLYSGRPEQAWSELYRLYHYTDVEAFCSEIRQTVSQSELFVSP